MQTLLKSPIIPDWGSAMMIILAGTKPEHLNMLEGGIIAKLLEEKWKTFAQGIFFKKMFITLIHLLTMSLAIYSRLCPFTFLRLSSSGLASMSLS